MTVVTAVRLGRLGDLVMTLPALRWLADAADLQVVTGPAYGSWLQAALPAARVVADVEDLAPANAVLDLHGVAASRRVLRRIPRAAGCVRVRTNKEGMRRRLLLAGVHALPPRWTWPERHLLAAARLAEQIGLADRPPQRALPSLTASGPVRPGALGLVPGAGWATKRWPVAHFGALAARWRQEVGGPVLVFGSADESELVRAVLAASEGAASAWSEPAEPLTGLQDGLGQCEVVVAGDTGPLHVAGALGRPTVALFGPTPRDSGFAFWPDAVLLGGASCSPCSMHGTDSCRHGHHRCLGDVGPEAVLGAALRLRAPGAAA